MRIRFWFRPILLLSCVSAFAQSPAGVLSFATIPLTPSVPENHEVRAESEALFYAPVNTLTAGVQKIILQQNAGIRVKLEMLEQNGYLYYLFQNEENSAFSIAGRGNYIVKRKLENGQFVQIKVFFRSDPGCFVRLYPQGQRSSMDVYLFDRPVDRGVLLPERISSLLTSPFSRVISLSRSTVDWETLLYSRSEAVDELVWKHVAAIRNALPTLSDGDDGALDAQRRYISIESGVPQGQTGGLNCSGFAKWIIDGFFHTQTGRYLEIEPLKEKHFDHRGNRWSLRFEEERDPYFGLDWSRNLASALWWAQGFPQTTPEDFDVRRVEYLAYREDVGFPVEDLKLLMFLEASANPGYFYIGSLNREYGTEPVLRQHFHMAVLFPYFTPSGSFRVAVFDRNRETTIDGTIKRFAGAYIHLVRLPVGESFLPPRPR